MTSSPVDAKRLEEARRQTFLALFTALAVALHTLEALLPSPAPWFRPGFANILTVTVLLIYGGRAAWSLTLARIGIGALFLGTIFTPGFFLSLSGGVAAVGVMSFAAAASGRRLGPVGVSALGATAHAFGQLLAARFLIVQHDGLWLLLPYFLLFSLVVGSVNGLIASFLVERMEEVLPLSKGAAAPLRP